MQVVYGDYHFIKVDSIDDLREAWSKRDGKSVIFVSECPDSQVTNLFVRYGAPTFVFIDDPVDVVGYLMASGTHGMSDALWYVSQSFSTLREISGLPAAFRIGRNHYETTVRDLVVEILRDVVGYADEEQIEKVMAIGIPNYPSCQETTVFEQIIQHFPQARRPGHYAPMLPDDVRETIEQIIGQYHPVVAGAELPQIIWPMKLFTHWDPAGEHYRGPVELAGPSRFLIWGPYMYLPRGDWIASGKIEICENFSGNKLTVDIAVRYAAEILAIGVFDLPVKGVYNFKLRFCIVEPKHPVEVRIYLNTGAIEGRFALNQVELIPGSNYRDGTANVAVAVAAR